MSADELIYRTRPAAGEAQGAVILLHGRGADENDLFPLFDMIDPQRRLVGISPRGPLSLPPGGAHWSRVLQVGYPDPTTFHPTFRSLQSWFDAVLTEVGVPTDRVVVGGFSQGCVMSYALALAQGRPRPAGLVGMSGFIPTVDDLTVDLSNAAGWPVMVGHGTLDPVIGVEWGRDAREQLEAAGADLIYREAPLGHTIDTGFLDDAAAWLEKVLPEARSALRRSNSSS